jgi:hypothetical protein
MAVVDAVIVRMVNVTARNSEWMEMCEERMDLYLSWVQVRNPAMDWPHGVQYWWQY